MRRVRINRPNAYAAEMIRDVGDNVPRDVPRDVPTALNTYSITAAFLWLQRRRARLGVIDRIRLSDPELKIKNWRRAARSNRVGQGIVVV